MEFSFFSLVVLSSLLGLIFTTFIIRKKIHTKSNAPPGPPKLPLIGNLHQLMGELPHHRITKLAKTYGPIMHIQLGQVSSVVVSSAQLAKEVLKDNDINFSQRRRVSVADIVFYNDTNMSFSPYGDYWRQMRKIAMVELLSSKRVQSFEFIREEEVSNSVRFVNSKLGTTINISDVIFTLINSIIARLVLGWKVEHQQELIHLIHRVMKSLDGSTLVDLFPSLKFLHVMSGQKSKLMKLHMKVDKMLEDIIEHHKTSRKGDESEPNSLLDVLLKLQGDPEYNFTNVGIKATILELFSGGVDSTAITIEWAVSELMKNPRAMKKAQEEVRKARTENGKLDETVVHELKYLKAVIKETLRLHPPGTMIPRQCKEDCTINGYTIKSKTDVLINSWAMGRDPNYWSEPESFYPERFQGSDVDYRGFNFEFLPFGSGRRMCPGIPLGTAHVEITLAHLLNHFDWELPGDMQPKDLDMTEAFGVAVRRKHDLYVIPTLPRSHGVKTIA